MSVLIPLKAGRTPTEIVLQTIWRGGVPDFVAQERDEAARREAEKERKRLEQAARREASNRRPWTDEENALLRKFYRKEGASERLQVMLGRDNKSVRSQARRLGLRVHPLALSRIKTVAARRREDGRRARREAQEARA